MMRMKNELIKYGRIDLKQLKNYHIGSPVRFGPVVRSGPVRRPDRAGPGSRYSIFVYHKHTIDHTLSAHFSSSSLFT